MGRAGTGELRAAAERLALEPGDVITLSLGRAELSVAPDRDERRRVQRASRRARSNRSISRRCRHPEQERELDVVTVYGPATAFFLDLPVFRPARAERRRASSPPMPIPGRVPSPSTVRPRRTATSSTPSLSCRRPTARPCSISTRARSTATTAPTRLRVTPDPGRVRLDHRGCAARRRQPRGGRERRRRVGAAPIPVCGARGTGHLRI